MVTQLCPVEAESQTLTTQLKNEEGGGGGWNLSLRLNFTADKGLKLNQWDFKVKPMQLRGVDLVMERMEEGGTEVKELEISTL